MKPEEQGRVLDAVIRWAFYFAVLLGIALIAAAQTGLVYLIRKI